MPAHGQVIRGALRSQATARPLERARVTAIDRDGRVVGETIADDSGRFTLRVDAKGVPFSLTVRRIGIEPSSTPEFELTPADTMEYELAIPETAVLGDTVRITGMASYNETKYQEAVRRGWKVFSPAEVAKHRDRVNNVYDLLRWADASLVIPSRRNECVRSARYLAGDRRMDRCMVWIVDGQVLGPLPILNPADTYFLAVLTASQSAVQFGDKAPWGAIVLYTRMNGDRLHP
ncbi:MAG: carboxypeptidase regulatory-like domain-containing protein [Gemmatimonadetes bacterium]|nr:carboxypeptidase regulatory-like domain-containing protein [Gemmatimonadota bacterium]